MRLLLLLAVASATAAVPRVKRQLGSESGFWWLKLEKMVEAENRSNTESLRTGNNGINGDGVSPATPIDEVNDRTDTTISPVNLFSNSENNFNSETGVAVVEPKIAGCSGKGTTCVPYYQCAEGKVITDGTGLIDIRWVDAISSHKFILSSNL